MTRTFTRNVLTVYVGFATSGASAVAAVLVAIRFLGPSGYGLFAIYGILASCTALFDLGIGRGLLRQLAAATDARQRVEYLRVALALYLLIAGVLVVSLPLELYLIPRLLFPVPTENVGAVQLIVAIAVVEYAVAIPLNLIQTSAMAEEGFQSYGRWLVVSGLCRNGLMIAAAVLTHSPVITAAAMIARRFLDLLIAPRVLPPLSRRAWRPHVDMTKVKALLTDSAGMAAVQGLQLTTISAGAVLVNGYLGLPALGLYRAQFDVASKLWFVSTGIGLVAFPRFTRLLGDRQGRARLAATFNTLLAGSWAAYSAITMVAALCVSAAATLTLWHEPSARQLLVLLILGVALNAHANLSSEFLQASGRYMVLIGANVGTLVILVLIFHAASGRVGPIAIGCAWAASQFVLATVADFAAGRTADLPLSSNAGIFLFKLAVLAAALTALLAVFGALPNVLFLFATGLVVGTTAVQFRRLWRSSVLEPHGA